MYLLDSSVVLELLLDQENADTVEKLLRAVPQQRLWLSEFSVHSIGIVLMRRGQHDVFVQVIDDLLISGGVGLVTLGPEELKAVAEASVGFGLDFDDAYQYVVAEKHELEIVSFDADFDRTPRGRKTPHQIAVA